MSNVHEWNHAWNCHIEWSDVRQNISNFLPTIFPQSGGWAACVYAMHTMDLCMFVLDISLMWYVSYFIEVVVVDSVVCVVGGVSSISFLWLLLLLLLLSSSSLPSSATPTRHHHRCQKNTHEHTYTHFQLEKNQRRSAVYCSVLHAVLAYTI